MQLLPSPPSQDGDRFWKIPECYIRGSTIKYLRIPDEVIDAVPEESADKEGVPARGGRGGARGGRGGDRGGRGRGGGDRGGAL